MLQSDCKDLERGSLGEIGYRAADLDKTTLLQHEDEIAGAQGVQSVGDHKGGAPLHQVSCRIQDRALRIDVDGTGGLIKDQNRAIPKESSGQ